MQNRNCQTWVRLVPTACLAVLLGLTGCGDSSTQDTASTAEPSTPTSPGASAVRDNAASPVPITTTAAGEPATPADNAWAQFQEQFSHPPEPPASWATTEPDETALAEFQRSRGAAAEKVADLAKDFYTRYESDPRSKEAREQEFRLLDAAVRLGHTNVMGRLETLEKARASDPSLSEDERFELLMTSGHRAAQMLLPQGMGVARESLQKTARELIAQFPQRPEPYGMLLSLASDAPPEEAITLAKSMLATNVPESARTSAQALLNKLESVGKPLALKFTAVDGREVDLESMRGKVVLIDFWATWCGPCIAELPNVKAAYERLNPKGFEILGISFDQTKSDLEEFVAKEKMTWPQYFDGKGWGNAFGQRFGIEGIPTMWLVDKKGILRDLNGRENLEEKVGKLLAESGPAEDAK